MNTKKYIEFAALLLAIVTLAFESVFGQFSIILRLTGFLVMSGIVWVLYEKYEKEKDIQSLIEQVKAGKISYVKRSSGLLCKLKKAITSYTNDQAVRAEELDEKVKTLEMQIGILDRSKHDTEAIIYSIRDAVIVVDACEKIVLANKAAQEIFEFDIHQVQYKNISEHLNNRDINEYIRKSLDSQASHVKHEIVIDKNKEPITYDCTISCLKGNDGRLNGAVAILHDITKEKQLSQIKSDFVSHVSHELKTPLASITAYAEMLSEDEIEDEKTKKEFYSIIYSQAQRLNNMIEDILNISRIESGVVKLNKEPLSVALLVNDAMEIIKSRAEEKNISIDHNCSVICDQVEADREMLLRVIINLLSNAVKYTNEGGAVTLTTETDSTDNLVRVSVKDNGVGIPEDDLSHVFDKFYRVSANNKCANGTGLGLNLVKQIVEEIHEGKVYVQSKQGQGSIFTFEFPLYAGETVKV